MILHFVIKCYGKYLNLKNYFNCNQIDVCRVTNNLGLLKHQCVILGLKQNILACDSLIT